MRKAGKSKPGGAGRRSWRAARPLCAGLAALAVAIGIVAGLDHLGVEALRQLAGRDRYRVRFADVECDSPGGLDRPTFLAEVRYLGNIPETFNALDAEDRARIAAAFAAHPWVVEVDGVRLERANAVHAKLRFRKPILVVSAQGRGLRLIDDGGVLLPASPIPPGIAELVDPVTSIPPQAGRIWSDETILRAVELVRAYRPNRIEKVGGSWRLTQSDGKTLVVG